MRQPLLLLATALVTISTASANSCPDLKGEFRSPPGSDVDLTVNVENRAENNVRAYTFNQGKNWFTANGQSTRQRDQDTGQEADITATCPNPLQLDVKITASGEEYRQKITVLNDREISVEDNIFDGAHILKKQ